MYSNLSVRLVHTGSQFHPHRKPEYPELYQGLSIEEPGLVVCAQMMLFCLPFCFFELLNRRAPLVYAGEHNGSVMLLCGHMGLP